MAILSHSEINDVSKPARYTGHELNTVVKDHRTMDCTVALALADVYEVGMSNLGLKILYHALNKRPDVAAERVYAPWIDMEEKLRTCGTPLYSLETFTPVKEFSLVGFSLQYEMMYSNVLNMLDLSGIPLLAAQRGLECPFIIGGGPCAYNPEPVADFFDLFVIGEGEEVMGELADAYIDWKREGRPEGRRGFLRRAVKLRGIYVPSLYAVDYETDGRVAAVRPLEDGVPAVVVKRVVGDLDAIDFIDKPVVPYIDIVHDRIMLELFRGCTRGCRFCQAGNIYRPVRERSPRRLKELARRLVDSTGYGEMSLTSLSSADYSCLGTLVDELLKEMRAEGISVSLPSLRIDSFSIELANKLQQVRKSGLTFAPEAGTQRLRDVINKGVTESDLYESVTAAFKQGWTSVKLYFMIGLPTETDDDIIGIAELGQKVVNWYREVKGRRGAKVTVSVSSFVPKANTPFQWFGQNSREELERKQHLLRRSITDRSIQLNYHDARVSELEGVFARGDRRLAPVILAAWQNGAKFDGWTEHFKYDVWLRALQECGVDAEFYNQRWRDLAEVLPWEHLSCGVTKEFLRREYAKALQGELTVDCRHGQCGACGVCGELAVKVIDWSERHDQD